MLIHSMDCDEGPGAHLICQKGEPKGTWEDSWKALESLVVKGKKTVFSIIVFFSSFSPHLNSLLDWVQFTQFIKEHFHSILIKKIALSVSPR